MFGLVTKRGLERRLQALGTSISKGITDVIVSNTAVLATLQKNRRRQVDRRFEQIERLLLAVRFADAAEQPFTVNFVSAKEATLKGPLICRVVLPEIPNLPADDTRAVKSRRLTVNTPSGPICDNIEIPLDQKVVEFEIGYATRFELVTFHYDALGNPSDPHRQVEMSPARDVIPPDAPGPYGRIDFIRQVPDEAEDATADQPAADVPGETDATPNQADGGPAAEASPETDAPADADATNQPGSTD